MTSTLFVFTGLTVSSARFAITGSVAASRATIAMICMYTLVFDMAFVALTYSEYLSPAQVALAQMDYSLLG